MRASSDVLSAPLTVNWTLSYRCNFGCRHCYSRDRTEDQLPLEDVSRIVILLAALGVVLINFGGGEPLVYPHLHHVAALASERGLNVSMNSNGYLLDGNETVRLAESGFTSVGISIDSPVASDHDQLRNMTGSFDRAVAALDNLARTGIKSTISCVINRLNLENWEGMVDLCRSHGVSTLYLHNYKCTGDALTNMDDLDLTPMQWRDFYVNALEVQKKVSDVHLSFDDPIMAALEDHRPESAVPGSTCGKLSLHIKPNGDITPCGFIPLSIGNILRDDFNSIWFESPVLMKMREKTPQGKCDGCSCYQSCLGGCTARVWALTGSFDSPDPHCWVAEDSEGE